MVWLPRVTEDLLYIYLLCCVNEPVELQQLRIILLGDTRYWNVELEELSESGNNTGYDSSSFRPFPPQMLPDQLG